MFRIDKDILEEAIKKIDEDKIVEEPVYNYPLISFENTLDVLNDKFVKKHTTDNNITYHCNIDIYDDKLSYSLIKDSGLDSIPSTKLVDIIFNIYNEKNFLSRVNTELKNLHFRHRMSINDDYMEFKKVLFDEDGKSIDDGKRYLFTDIIQMVMNSFTETKEL